MQTIFSVYGKLLCINLRSMHRCIVWWSSRRCCCITTIICKFIITFSVTARSIICDCNRFVTTNCLHTSTSDICQWQQRKTILSFVFVYGTNNLYKQRRSRKRTHFLFLVISKRKKRKEKTRLITQVVFLLQIIFIQILLKLFLKKLQT